MSLERLVQEADNKENTNDSTFASITFDTSIDTTFGSIYSFWLGRVLRVLRP